MRPGTQALIDQAAARVRDTLDRLDPSLFDDSTARLAGSVVLLDLWHALMAEGMPGFLVHVEAWNDLWRQS